MGKLYTDAGGTTGTIRAFVRGGNWNYGAYAGAFALPLSNAPTNTHSSIGFRCSR